MTFGEFKQLDYPADCPLEYVLTEIMFKGLLNVNVVLSAYSGAIEKDRHIRRMRFEEACINLTQLLNGNYKGKDLKEAQQRAIHTLNLTETLPKNILNSNYDYTDEVKKKWDEFCKTMYGIEL